MGGGRAVRRRGAATSGQVGVRVVLVVASALILGAVSGTGIACAQGYVPSGTAITGGDDAGSAVALAPGQYVDTLARGSVDASADGSARYYALSVRAGETPYFAATVAPRGPVSTGERLALSIELTAAGETSTCDTESGSDDGNDDRLASVTTVATPGPAGSTGGCPPGKLVARVARAGDYGVHQPLAVELAYRLEPAADTVGLPSTSARLALIRPELTGRPAALRSGTSFATAPVLGTGIYRDTLTADDTRVVRVHLDWGQRLAYSIASSAQPGVGSGDALDVVATIRNPVRVAVDPASGGTDRASVGAADAGLVGSTPAPVRYADRDSTDTGIAACSIAGDWFLVLETDHPSQGTADTTVPYTLQVQVFGTSEGAPEYQPEPGRAGSSGGSDPATGAPAGGADGSGATSRTPLIIGVASGLVVAAAAAVMVLLVLRRRRTGQARAHTHTPSG